MDLHLLTGAGGLHEESTPRTTVSINYEYNSMTKLGDWEGKNVEIRVTDDGDLAIGERGASLPAATKKVVNITVVTRALVRAIESADTGQYLKHLLPEIGSIPEFDDAAEVDEVRLKFWFPFSIQTYV